MEAAMTSRLRTLMKDNFQNDRIIVLQVRTVFWGKECQCVLYTNNFFKLETPYFLSHLMGGASRAHSDLVLPWHHRHIESSALYPPPEGLQMWNHCSPREGPPRTSEAAQKFVRQSHLVMAARFHEKMLAGKPRNLGIVTQSIIYCTITLAHPECIE